ncbi:hypothetical protein [Microbispora sp. ATCC PTA-5024]|uniref:hypothetical protein n=1 Tax=Microbispora sp. ATCC PTA-5024 TaxID=316330 RepID=UPI0003DCA13C|nr:hypothetical protein [Microbispora sp. ATCC PTA-5024]ETK36154.1 hypothetical protein MPTA5024_11045 [Microbispora sp. ATCC PTA-5024]
MPEIPADAVQAALAALTSELGDLSEIEVDRARMAVEAAAPVLAECIASSLMPVWEWTREVAGAHRTTYGVDAVGRCMRIAREAFTSAPPEVMTGDRSGVEGSQAAPESTESAPEGVSRGVGSSAHPIASETLSALRALARFRKFLDDDFRFWCSPNGIAARYAGDLIEHLDRFVSEEQTGGGNG